VTIDKLLGYTSAELRAISDADAAKLFEPYLHITRPERAVRVESAKGGVAKKAGVAAANAMFAELGLDFKL